MEVALKNLASPFFEHAEKNPDQPALILPKKWNDSEVESVEELSFGQLLSKVRDFQRGLERENFKTGDRVLILIPLSLDLYAFVIALFSRGIVPVFLEPGMPLRQMLRALKDSGAKAIVSVDALLKFRFVLPPLWGVKLYSVEGAGFLKRAFEKFKVPSDSGGNQPLVWREFHDHALITFTTGSTGRPKGADRNHGILSTQHLLSQSHWPEIAGEIDMPAFPMIGFQNLACGITTLLPAFDNGDLSTLRPSVIANQILSHNVTRLSAAPFLLKIIAENLLERRLKAPGVRSLIAGGAPVPSALCEKLMAVFPNAQCFVVYGSTEAEPISYISMEEILRSPGDGYLVGRPLDVLKVKIDTNGEIVIHGPHVVRRYVNNESANRETKFMDREGRHWHRTGDTGYFDAHGRLWITGRLSDRVSSQGRQSPNLVLEKKLESLEGISRAALIETGNGVVAFLEPAPGCDPETLQKTVREQSPSLLGFPLQEIRHRDKLPVDRRHRWKIDRHALRNSLSSPR